jgi:hypothetical protein
MTTTDVRNLGNAEVQFPTHGALRHVHDAIAKLMQQVRAEYAEMPGLSITLAQAQRLWTVDRVTCEEAFKRLTASGVLKRTSKGRFIRM